MIKCDRHNLMDELKDYDFAGKELKTVYVAGSHEQRAYFSFYDYEYKLDVTKQNKFLPKTKPLIDGLMESYEWYRNHQNEVNEKTYFKYIDEYLK